MHEINALDKDSKYSKVIRRIIKQRGVTKRVGYSSRRYVNTLVANTYEIKTDAQRMEMRKKDSLR